MRKLEYLEGFESDLQRMLSVNDLPYADHDVRLHILDTRVNKRTAEQNNLLRKISELHRDIRLMMIIDNIERGNT